jgi:anthranilate phosphoribosyltransferase
MNFTDYLRLLHAHENLNRVQAEEFLSFILDDDTLPEEQIAKALTVLTEKGVDAEEVCGFVDAMRARMLHVPYDGEAIDTCGTGGDKKGAFNISTAAAILLAGAGLNVAKHGNRAATSKCGSADVLEALGIPVDLSPEDAAKQLTGHGFVFLFAPLYHPALKRFIGVRKQLGFPTVFNLLGPLLNPAGVRRQVLGTFSLENAGLLAEVMARIGGYEHAVVITSDDGMDEASLEAPVTVFEIKGGEVKKSRVQAGDYGLGAAPISELLGGDAETNARIITDALKPSGSLSAHQRIIVFNAALGFYVAGKAPSIDDGIKMAIETLNSGKAAAKLKELTGAQA